MNHSGDFERKNASKGSAKTLSNIKKTCCDMLAIAVMSTMLIGCFSVRTTIATDEIDCLEYPEAIECLDLDQDLDLGQEEVVSLETESVVSASSIVSVSSTDPQIEWLGSTADSEGKAKLAENGIVDSGDSSSTEAGKNGYELDTSNPNKEYSIGNGTVRMTQHGGNGIGGEFIHTIYDLSGNEVGRITYKNGNSNLYVTLNENVVATIRTSWTAGNGGGNDSAYEYWKVTGDGETHVIEGISSNSSWLYNLVIHTVPDEPIFFCEDLTVTPDNVSSNKMSFNVTSGMENIDPESVAKKYQLVFSDGTISDVLDITATYVHEFPIDEQYLVDEYLDADGNKVLVYEYTVQATAIFESSDDRLAEATSENCTKTVTVEAGGSGEDEEEPKLPSTGFFQNPTLKATPSGNGISLSNGLLPLFIILAGGALVRRAHRKALERSA